MGDLSVFVEAVSATIHAYPPGKIWVDGDYDGDSLIGFRGVLYSLKGDTSRIEWCLMLHSKPRLVIIALVLLLLFLLPLVGPLPSEHNGSLPSSPSSLVGTAYANPGASLVSTTAAQYATSRSERELFADSYGHYLALWASSDVILGYSNTAPPTSWTSTDLGASFAVASSGASYRFGVAGAYDSTNDRLWVLWETTTPSIKVAYLNVTRDGSHNISGYVASSILTITGTNNAYGYISAVLLHNSEVGVAFGNWTTAAGHCTADFFRAQYAHSAAPTYVNAAGTSSKVDIVSTDYTAGADKMSPVLVERTNSGTGQYDIYMFLVTEGGNVKDLKAKATWGSPNWAWGAPSAATGLFRQWGSADYDSKNGLVVYCSTKSGADTKLYCGTINSADTDSDIGQTGLTSLTRLTCDLAIDTTTGDYYAFYSQSNDLYYMKRSGGSWGGAIQFTTLTGSETNLTPVTKIDNAQGRIELLWTHYDGVSAYSVYYDYIGGGIVSTVTDIFVANWDNFINVTVTDAGGRTAILNVTMQVYTVGDAQNFILKWDQTTNTFSEYSDPSGIVTINAAGSLNSTYSTNGWVVDFKFKFTAGFTPGICRVVSSVSDASLVSTVSFTNLFYVGNVNRVFLRFDDSTEDHYTTVLPVLQTYSVTGTFYLIYNNIGTFGHLTWTQIGTMVSDGEEMGSHTRTHANLNSVSASQLTDELSTVKNDFLTQGVTTMTLAYPYDVGWNNATVTTAVNAAGYLYAIQSGQTTWSRSTGIKTSVNAFTAHNTTGLSGFKSWVNQAHDDTEVVVLYHTVTTGSSDYDVSASDFTQEVAYLHNKGFTTLPMSQVGTGIPITFLRTGIAAGTTGTVLTLNGTAYTLTQFPIGLLGNSGDPQTVAASTPISVSSGKQYAFSSWTNGDGLASASGTYTTPSSAATVTVTYKTQWAVNFTSSGIAGDTSGTVVTIGGVAKTQAVLPFTSWVNDTTGSVTYAYSSPVSATAGKQYVWSTTSGCSVSTQSGTVSAISASCLVTGTYGIQYQLTVTLNGYGTSTPTSGTWENAAAVVQVTVGSDASNSSTTRRLYNGATGSGTGSYTGSLNPFSVTMNAPITEDIAWQIQYTVTITLNGYGTTTPASGTWENSGAVVPITIGSDASNSSDTRRLYNGATGVGAGSYTGSSNPFSVTMNAPITENIAWKVQYYFTVTDVHDTGTGQGWYDDGANVNSTVTRPTGGFDTTGWTGTGNLTSGGVAGSNTTGIFVIHAPSTCTWNWAATGGTSAFPLNTCLTYNSGAGATGKVCALDDYTFASIIINNATGIFFNATGVSLPSNQFQFRAWNTSATGVIPIKIETGTVKPTYSLNVTSYSYSLTHIALTTQLSNQTASVYFGAIVGDTKNRGLQITQAQTIVTAPTHSESSSNPRLTFQVSASSIGNTIVESPVLGVPISVAVGGNLTFYSAGHWTWNDATEQITIPIPVGTYGILITWDLASPSTGGQTTPPVANATTPSTGSILPNVTIPAAVQPFSFAFGLVSLPLLIGALGLAAYGLKRNEDAEAIIGGVIGFIGGIMFVLFGSTWINWVSIGISTLLKLF